MPIMIKLTSNPNKYIWINAQKIMWMRGYGNYTMVCTQEEPSGTFIVKETPEEIHMIIEQEAKNMNYVLQGRERE